MTAEDTVHAVASASTWPARVAFIRKVPEQFGTAAHQAIYSEIAKRVYVPHLAPDFAYLHWRDEYELPDFQAAYTRAHDITHGFHDTSAERLAFALIAEPTTLRIFRTILGLTTQEFAASTATLVDRFGIATISPARVKGIEAGRVPSDDIAAVCAAVIDEAIRGVLFGAPEGEVRSKTDKPDTVAGWGTVQAFAADGVPLSVFLHQRHYGGAFRQLLDATSTKRGNLLEDAVEDLFTNHQVPYVRTGSHNQEEIARRFGITVKPAPDFVVFDASETLHAMLECKGANDGGTARDKASRFNSLRGEAARLGGIPLFAVLAGLGWRRTSDALGPVVRDTDGRVFTIPTLDQMLTVPPFPDLVETTEVNGTTA